jgi:Regulator of polyketide synthase expression
VRDRAERRCSSWPTTTGATAHSCCRRSRSTCAPRQHRGRRPTLYVHPNTLRQRLRRIQDLTGLDVAREDWLMIEIELKLHRLR